jgi:hypothetical protein
MTTGKRKILRYAAIILGFVIFICVCLIIYAITQSSSLEKQIAEFETKRRIPDSENAAVIYEILFTDANLTENFPDDIYKKIRTLADYDKPWEGKDYLEVVAFIENNQTFISMLLETTKYDKCYFPLPANLNEFNLEMPKLGTFRSWVQLLSFAANNDVAEGRLDEAIEKNLCILKMGEHWCQQSLIVDYLVGTAVESLSLSNLKELILEEKITEEQLRQIEEFPFQIKDTWSEKLSQLIKGENLFSKTMLGGYSPLYNIITIFTRQFSSRDPTLETTHNLYLRVLSGRRANKILIALRRYKSRNGQWPENLEEIKSFIQQPEVLIDPMNNGSFVYKKTEDSFTLYSKGPNNIDEGDSWDEPADDWTIWPTP